MWSWQSTLRVKLAWSEGGTDRWSSWLLSALTLSTYAIVWNDSKRKMIPMWKLSVASQPAVRINPPAALVAWGRQRTFSPPSCRHWVTSRGGGGAEKLYLEPHHQQSSALNFSQTGAPKGPFILGGRDSISEFEHFACCWKWRTRLTQFDKNSRNNSSTRSSVYLELNDNIRTHVTVDRRKEREKKRDELDRHARKALPFAEFRNH